MTKNKIGRYLRARWITSELQETSAMAIELGNDGFAGGSGELKRGGEKGRRRRLGSSFIGGGAAIDGRVERADWALALHAQWRRWSKERRRARVR